MKAIGTILGVIVGIFVAGLGFHIFQDAICQSGQVWILLLIAIAAFIAGKLVAVVTRL